jgi:integrase
MASIKFNLKNNNSKTKTLIYLILNYRHERLKISTEISVIPKNWNKNKQRVKELLDIPNHHHINLSLEKMSLNMIEELNKHIEKYGALDKDILKESFTTSIKLNKNTKKVKKSFWDYFEEFIEYKDKHLDDIRDYNNSLRKHLIATEKLLKTRTSFENIKLLDNGFIDKMENYLTYKAINSKKTEGLSVNTIGKQFKNLRVFLNWCFEREYVNPFPIKHIKVNQEIIDEVYMDEDELNTLIKLKLTNDLEIKVRDGFILGCNTALRFSDLNLLRRAHINKTKGKETIELQQKKTKKKVVIALGKTSFKILKKYDYESPIKKINSIVFNKTIRKICKDAKMDTIKTQYKTIQGKLQEIDYKKYELISSHTCRRTFCTLQVKKGTPISFIMAITGHKTEKNFLRYLKLDEQTAAEEMRKFMD